MRKISVLSILLVISGCKGKQANDNFPEFEFRSNPELLGDFKNFGQFSLILPKNYNLNFQPQNVQNLLFLLSFYPL